LFARFSPDGQRIAIAGMGNTFYVWQWNVAWQVVLQTACERLFWHPFIQDTGKEEVQEIRATCETYTSVTFPRMSPSAAPGCLSVYTLPAQEPGQEPEFIRGAEGGVVSTDR
jgi:hypothetical protein